MFGAGLLFCLKGAGMLAEGCVQGFSGLYLPRLCRVNSARLPKGVGSCAGRISQTSRKDSAEKLALSPSKRSFIL